MIIKKNIDSLLQDQQLKKKLIESLDAEELYRIRREDILKQVHIESTNIKFDRKQMEFRYTGLDGHTYFAFPDALGLPIERFGKMKYFLMWMSSGISPKEFTALLDKASQALSEGIKDPKNAAMIGMCIEEMRGRERLTLHTELLYNFLAVQWVRDDEDPLTYNNQIQLQKVDALKKETESGNTYFFFQQKEIKLLSTLFRMSEIEWQKYWKESLSSQEYLTALQMMKFSSAKEADPSIATSKKV